MPTISADGKYWVDLSFDPTFGSFVATHPENLAFDDEIRGVGNCSWQFSFSALDQDNNPVVSGHDFIGPYRSYFRLRYGDVAIMAGPIVSWTTILGTDYMSVAGKTWEHIVEKWEYPFDGRDAHVNDYQFLNAFQNDELTGSGNLTPTGLAYEASNRDLIRIISDLFSQTMNVPNRVIFDISNLAGLSGIKTNYQLSLGDSSKMFNLINDLSGIGNGFDWWISHDMKFFWASPYRYGNPSSPSIIYIFDGSTDAKKPNDLQFTNNGPPATHVQGRGAGLASSSTLSRSFGYTPAQTQFSRLDESYDFGDVRNAAELIKKTQKQLALDLNPAHVIPLQVDPARITNFWSTFRKGRAIYIDYEMIAHRIDSGQQLKKYSANVTLEGECLVDFELSQVYSTSTNAGSPEG